MASFLSPNYVPEFNPAISTIPIDLYGKVIMQKQAEYNQGIERTQAYIQNVTGLEMGRQQDQEYYNQKVGDYKQKIQGLLTSDFSSRDVAMQTSSFSSQLYNDKRIRGSVMSRLYEKDYYQQLEQARKDGTYAPENADQGLRAIQDWKNGSEEATLGKMSYTPYDNYLPRLQAYMKTLNPDVRIDQYSPKGADGKPIPYVLVDGKIQAIDDSKVMAAYNTFFDTDVQARQQRSLTTAYNSRNMSDEAATGYLKSLNDNALKSIDNDIKYREQLLVTQSQDPQRVQQLNQEIELLKSNRQRREENYLTDLNNFSQNPLQVKANIYDQLQRRQMADVFGYKQESQKYVEDPLWAATFKVNQAAQQQQNSDRDYDLRVRAENRLTEKDRREADKELRDAQAMNVRLQPETLILADENNSKPEEVDKRISADLKESGQQMLKFIYDAATYDENGVMKSANNNLVVKNGDVYSYAPGATAKQVSDALMSMKKNYDNNTLNASSRINDIYEDYFGGYNDNYGYNKMLKAVEVSDNWEAAKRRGGTETVRVTQSLQNPLNQSTTVLEDGTVVTGLDTRFVKKWESNENVKELAKVITEDYAAPSVSIVNTKESKDQFDSAKNTSVRIVENIYSGNSSLQEGYKKAIKDAVGMNVAYDKYNNRYQLYVQTLGERVEPLTISYNQAVALTSAEQVNAITNPADQYSALRRQQRQRGGVTDMMPVNPKNGDYRFQWKSEERGGRQYPVLQYRPNDGNETEWTNLSNYFQDLQGVYDFNQMSERLRYLKYSATPEEIQEIIRRR